MVLYPHLFISPCAPWGLCLSSSEYRFVTVPRILLPLPSLGSVSDLSSRSLHFTNLLYNSTLNVLPSSIFYLITFNPFMFLLTRLDFGSLKVRFFCFCFLSFVLLTIKYTMDRVVTNRKRTRSLVSASFSLIRLSLYIDLNFQSRPS